jgi:hypothetical protein
MQDSKKINTIIVGHWIPREWKDLCYCHMSLDTKHKKPKCHEGLDLKHRVLKCHEGLDLKHKVFKCHEWLGNMEPLATSKT